MFLNFPNKKVRSAHYKFSLVKKYLYYYRTIWVRSSRAKCSARLTYMDLKIYELRLTEVSAYSNEFGDESQKLVMN